MTAAYRLKGLGWFGGCVAVALAFYLVSLQVANERKKLDALNGRILFAERDIRALETEFDTRANLVQLEKWNGDTLALTAPIAGQFVPSESALAAIDFDAIPLPGGQAGGAPVRTAQLLVPSLMTASSVPAATPAPVAAPAVQRAVVQMAAVAPVKPQVIRAAVQSAKAEAAIVRTAAVAKVRPQAVAMLDRKLLSDSTLGDILSRSRSEARRR